MWYEYQIRESNGNRAKSAINKYNLNKLFASFFELLNLFLSKAENLLMIKIV